jgi:hypothetical protein
MKTLDLSVAALVVGVLGASFAGCSAESSGTPPRTTNGGSSSTTGGTGTSTGGTGTGTGGTGTGTGGTGTGTGGTGTGTGGTGTGTGGTGIGTGGTSSGGAGAMSCGTLQASASDAKCCVASGMAADLAIDSLEDGDNTILPIGNRQGYWYTYNDMDPATTQTPKPSTTFAPTAGGNPCSLMPVPGACAGPAGGMLFSADTTGMLTANDVANSKYKYAGMGFDFNNHFKKSCVYNGTAYHGISFYVKSSVQFAVQVKTAATTTMNDLAAGTCTTKCDDNFAAPVPAALAWTQQKFMFADLKQAGFGTPVAAIDPATLIGVQFQVAGDTVAFPFDVAIDDVAFVP